MVSLYDMNEREVSIQLMKVTFLGLPTENVLLSVVVMGSCHINMFWNFCKCFKWNK